VSWWSTRIAAPLQAQLTQGVTPSRLASALALGAVVGVVPVLGVTTLLSAAAAAFLRLNQPAVQVANYLCAPLQLVLFLPLFRAGAAVFGGPPVVLSLSQLQAELSADLGGTVVRYLGASLRAVGIWALVAPLAFAALHLALRPLLARLPLPVLPAAIPPVAPP
jgi:uncharacterized protein (DUF2062 family)